MEGVPRLDRWLQAAALLERFDSLCDFQRAVLTARPLNGLPDDGKDSSRKVGAQLILSLSVPLEWRDYEAIASATTSSVGLDERDGLILVHARVWVRSVGELYECLLGSFRHLGTTPEEAAEALRRVVENAFTLRVGQQGLRHEPKGKDAQKTEHFFKARWSAFRKSVRTALADGGPSEQRALFELSAAAPTPANRVNPFFRNLSEISRDRPHKWYVPTSKGGVAVSFCLFQITSRFLGVGCSMNQRDMCVPVRLVAEGRGRASPAYRLVAVVTNWPRAPLSLRCFCFWIAFSSCLSSAPPIVRPALL